MLASKKCSHFVCDRDSGNMRKCKNKVSVHFPFLKLCTCHVNCQQRFRIVKLQALWKSYKVRCKINNIFVKLPSEIQNVVLYYMRFDWYVQQKYIPSVLKVYISRCSEIEKSLMTFRNEVARRLIMIRRIPNVEIENVPSYDRIILLFGDESFDDHFSRNELKKAMNKIKLFSDDYNEAIIKATEIYNLDEL